MTARVDPLGLTTTLAYDTAGNLVTTTNPRGYTTTASYDVTFGGTEFAGQDVPLMVADASNLLGAIDNGKLLSSVNFGASLLDGPAIVVVTTQDASADADAVLFHLPTLHPANLPVKRPGQT